MSLSKKELDEIVAALQRISPSQQAWIKKALKAFEGERDFQRNQNSDIVTPQVLEAFGDRLLSHHANSRQALNKHSFEFALEAALNSAGIPSQLANTKNNPGHDITIAGVQVCLKSEAAAGIRDDILHISKWMELGKGTWDLPLLRDAFLKHMQNYERILTLRCLKPIENRIRYELVEIPKALLLEARSCTLQVQEKSKQIPKPGYGYVHAKNGELKFALYFDGGTERKLQIKGLRKSLCKVHATWQFNLPAP